MKKILLPLVILFFLGIPQLLNAQCYGYVKFDSHASANGGSTFNIVTTHTNDLILIAYDGWSAPGSGPVTVDGNNATHLATANTGNSGTSEVYYYSAPLAGTHTIVCTETGYNASYYLNMAAAFYDSATCTPLSGASVTVAQNAFAGNGSNSVVVTTTTPNELIYNTAEFNTGSGSYGQAPSTGAKDLDSIHVGTGLDANQGYTKAPTTGPYTIGSTDPLLNGGGGGTEIVVALIPGTCSSAFTVTNNITEPSCRNNDGQVQLTLSGGTPPITYTWTPNVSTTSSATGLSAGTYVVKVTSNDGACSTVLDTIRLVGATIATSSIDAKCVPAASGYATVTVTNGKSPFTYAWNNGETTQTATGLTAGKYTVTVTDGVGCTTSVSVNVSSYPAPKIVATPPVDSVCYSSGVVITASGGKSYVWTPALGVSCPTCPNPTLSPSVATVYTVTGTDSNGCTNTAVVNIKVRPLPRPVITGIDTICIGTGTTLSVTGGTTYVWTPGSNSNTSYRVTPPVTTTYTVKATTDGCSHDTTVKVLVVPVPTPNIAASQDSVCVGDSLTLEGSGGTSYRWSPGNSTNKKLTIAHLLNATTYTLYAFGGTCEDSAVMSIGVIQPVTATIQITRDSVCPKQSTTITALGSGGKVTYRWSNGATTSSITVNDTVTTTYTATVKGTCDSIQKVMTVVVIPLPKPVITGNRYVCAGYDTLSVSSSTNPTVYLWGNNQVGTSIVANVKKDTVIRVTAYNKLGCSVTDTFEIKEAGYPIVHLSYPEACGTGNYVTITADTAGGSGPYKYSWSSGGTKDTTRVYINKTGTIFTLVVSNQFGCSATASATVIIDNPQLYACCSTTILLGGDTEILASGVGVTKLQWTPPNSGLSCYTCPNPTATPTVTTTYTVSGVDSADCPVERTVTIIVETPCYNFIVPNVFTPTNAGTLGLDNILYIPTHGFTDWSLKIYDRWGHTVYSSTNPNNYWDGKNGSGGNAPEGVYYYVIDASCTGNSFQKEGFVQLIR